MILGNEEPKVCQRKQISKPIKIGVWDNEVFLTAPRSCNILSLLHLEGNPGGHTHLEICFLVLMYKREKRKKLRGECITLLVETSAHLLLPLRDLCSSNQSSAIRNLFLTNVIWEDEKVERKTNQGRVPSGPVPFNFTANLQGQYDPNYSRETKV